MEREPSASRASEYRAYRLRGRKVLAVFEITAANDGEAFSAALEFQRDDPVELWHAGRLIATLWPASDTGPARGSKASAFEPAGSTPTSPDLSQDTFGPRRPRRRQLEAILSPVLRRRPRRNQSLLFEALDPP
jgi:hypothetical protein